MLVLFSRLSEGQVTPYFEKIGPKDHDGSGSNFDMEIDSSGVFYLGTYGGVVSYNGFEWKNLGGPVPSFHIKVIGSRLYAGSFDTFGYFDLEQIEKPFINISDSLPYLERDLPTQFLMHNKKLYVLGDSYLHEIGNGKYKSWPNNTYPRFNIMEVVNDEIVVSDIELGARVLRNDSLVNIPNLFPPLKNADKHAYIKLRKFEGVYITMGSYNSFSLEHEGFKEDNIISSVIRNELKGTQITAAAQFNDSTYVIGTSRDGAFIVQGDSILYTLTRDNGFSNTVRDIIVDDYGTVMISTFNGLYKVFEPFRYSNFSHGFNDVVFNMEVSSKWIVYASGSELVVIDKTTQMEVLVAKSASSIRNVEILGDHIFTNTTDGVFVYSLDDSELQQFMLGEERMWFWYKESDDEIVVLNDTGFYSLKNIGGKIVETKLNGKSKGDMSIKLRIITQSVIKDLDGNYWFASKGVGIGKYNANNNTLEEFDTNDGLPDVISPWLILHEGEVKAGTSKGIYKFKPVSYLDKNYEKELSFVKDKSFYDDHIFYDDLEIKNDTIWFGEGNRLGTFVKNGNKYYPLQNQLRLKNDQIWDIEFDDGFIWLAGDNALRVDFKKAKEDSNKLKTYIRTVYYKDSLVYNSSLELDNLFPYYENSIRFNYAIDDYTDMSRSTYSVKLEGFDNKWSVWSVGQEKEYTNLGPGAYSLLVKGKNIHGIMSEVSEYKFIITAPFYMKPIAIVIYVILLIIIFLAALRFYTLNMSIQRNKLRLRIKKSSLSILKRDREISDLKKKLNRNT